MRFVEKWRAAVEAKNSVLCAGLDPAVSEMRRDGKSLSPGTSKRDWALCYLESVGPWCAAVKLNVNYWKSDRDPEVIREIVALAHSMDLVTIEDCKLADIGSTNDAGMFHAAQKGIDAVTFSPFAGNIEEAARQAEARKLGLISMCLMSNPEYRLEKRKLVEIEEAGAFPDQMIERVGGVPYVRQYQYLAHRAAVCNIDGVVIGAPSASNHLRQEELAEVSTLLGRDTLVLVPGIGAQGGQADVFWRHFQPDRVLINCGRSLMFPASGTHAEQAQTLSLWLNELRRSKHEK